jgi:hypothetical protein
VLALKELRLPNFSVRFSACLRLPVTRKAENMNYKPEHRIQAIAAWTWLIAGSVMFSSSLEQASARLVAQGCDWMRHLPAVACLEFIASLARVTGSHWLLKAGTGLTCRQLAAGVAALMACFLFTDWNAK